MADKIVIGLVGKQGSGKGTYVRGIKLYLSEQKIEHLKSGGLLIELLNILKLPISRINLQTMAGCLRKNFGEDIISNAIKFKIIESQAEIIIFDSVRWKSDERVIKSFPGGVLVHIDADTEARFNRLKNRGEKEDEKGLSREDFDKAEAANTEIEISDIAIRADIKIANDSTEEVFMNRVGLFTIDLLRSG